MKGSKYSWLYVYITDLSGMLRRVLIRVPEGKDPRELGALGKLDGSSVRGFTTIEESDLVLKIDPETLLPYPWCGGLCEEGVGRVFADVYWPGGIERLPFDPRFAAQKTEQILNGMGYRSVVGVELEFFIFDGLEVEVHPWRQYLEIFSQQAPWSLDASTKIKMKDGYYVPSPQDTLEGLIRKIIKTLEEYYGIKVEATHHEVAAAGQYEINFQPGTIKETSDRIQLIKEAVKTEAARDGKTATFMPKPITGDNGNGAHVHVSLWKGDENAFYDENDPYAGLSDIARSFIAGLIEHGPALSAIVNPTVNSYKRLVPGFEAPIYLVWSKSNRSAAIRIPSYMKNPRTTRLEFRSPDPSMNPYLALSAIILAGLDGVRKKLDPGSPVDENVYRMPAHRRRQLGIRVLPRSLHEALDHLESDHDWLLHGWTKEMYERYVEIKREEASQVGSWVGPAELEYYINS